MFVAGNIADDIAVLVSKGGKEYCRFAVLAYNKGKDGNVYDRYYIPCVAFGDSAKKLAGSKRGRHILLQGALSVNSYEYNGEKRRDVRVVVRNVIEPDDEVKRPGVDFVESDNGLEDIPF